MAKYSSNDRNIAFHIESEKEVSIEDIVLEAKNIWHRVKKGYTTINGSYTEKPQEYDRLFEEIHKNNPEFSKSYPIVIRYMVYMQEFNTKALVKYINRMRNHYPANETEYIELQAEYVSLLYKETHPRWDQNNVNKLHSNICMILNEETAQFKNNLDKAEKKVTAKYNLLKSQSLKELIGFVHVASESFNQYAGTLRIESDIPTANVSVLPEYTGVTEKNSLLR